MKSPGDSEAGDSDAESSTEGEEEGEGEVDHGLEVLVSGKSLEEVATSPAGPWYPLCCCFSGCCCPLPPRPARLRRDCRTWRQPLSSSSPRGLPWLPQR